MRFSLTGALLLEEVVTVAGIEGINAIVDAAKERFIESQSEKAAGSAFWWRVSRVLFSLRNNFRYIHTFSAHD